MNVLLEGEGAWRVEEGWADLFSVPEGGARRFVARFGKGDTLFAFSEGGLLAVPGPGGRLEPTDATDGIDTWVLRLSAACTPSAASGGQFLEDGQEIELQPGERAGARRVLWAEAVEGRLRHALDGECEGPLPVTRHTWIEAVDGARVRASAQGSPEALAAFHKLVLHRLERKRAEAAEAEKRRAQARAVAEESAMDAALSGLASIVGQRDLAEEGVSSDDRLYDSMRLVALARGIQLERRDGGSVADLARASRVRVRRVTLRWPWWKRDNGPLLGFRRSDGAPVALLPHGPSGYRAVGLSEKPERISSKKKAAELKARAYQLYPALPARAGSPWRMLRFALQGCGSDLTRAALMGVFGGLLGLLVPIVTGRLVSDAIPAADSRQISALGVALLVAALASALFDFVRAVAVQRIEGKMDGTAQCAVWDRILALPARFFRDYSAGDLAMRAMSIETMRETVTGATLSTLLGAIFSSFSLGLMFYYSVPLALLAMAMIGALALLTLASGRYQVHLDALLLETQGKISGFVLQILNGIAKIRVAGAEGRAFARWSRQLAVQKKITWDNLGAVNWLTVLNATFPTLGAMVLFLGMTKASQGTSTPMPTGDFLAFYAAFGQFSAALLGLSSAITSTLSVVPMFERLRPILETAPEYGFPVEPGEDPGGSPDPGPLQGVVELSHVSFRYEEKGQAVLTDVSLRAEAGELVAVVGPSGGGKSTLFRLLLGFEAPTAGAVYFDGQDLQSVDVQAVRRQMGVVLQDSRVMPGDVLGNIVGSSDKTEDDAWQAAAMAGLDRDIDEMPMGMHTVVMEGGGAFSGGQRQRLMIARAIVNRPRILLLDEATSALDGETQEAVTRSLESLRATRIVIAHRLSTIRNADRIYVLDGGRIVQSGTFEQLMRSEGTFQRLVRPQTLG